MPKSATTLEFRGPLRFARLRRASAHMATRTTSDWPRYCGAGAVPRPRVDWPAPGRWGYGDGVRPSVPLASQQGVAQHCPPRAIRRRCTPRGGAVLRQRFGVRVSWTYCHEGAVSDFLFTYLDSIDERLLEYLDEDEELELDAVQRLRFYTSALLEGSITPDHVMEDWPDWYQLAPAFVATY